MFAFVEYILINLHVIVLKLFVNLDLDLVIVGLHDCTMLIILRIFNSLLRVVSYDHLIDVSSNCYVTRHNDEKVINIVIEVIDNDVTILDLLSLLLKDYVDFSFVGLLIGFIGGALRSSHGFRSFVR